MRESDPGPMLWPDMESAAETVEVLCDRAEKAEGGLALLQLKFRDLERLFRDFQRLSETFGDFRRLAETCFCFRLRHLVAESCSRKLDVWIEVVKNLEKQQQIFKQLHQSIEQHSWKRSSQPLNLDVCKSMQKWICVGEMLPK